MHRVPSGNHVQKRPMEFHYDQLNERIISAHCQRFPRKGHTSNLNFDFDNFCLSYKQCLSEIVGRLVLGILAQNILDSVADPIRFRVVGPNWRFQSAPYSPYRGRSYFRRGVLTGIGNWPSCPAVRFSRPVFQPWPGVDPCVLRAVQTGRVFRFLAASEVAKFGLGRMICLSDHI